LGEVFVGVLVGYGVILRYNTLADRGGKTTVYLAEQYEQIVAAFELVLSTLNRLCMHIQNDLAGYPALLADKQGVFVDDKNMIASALKNFEPVMSLTPQETQGYPGAVGCTPTTFKLINAVNQAKDTFKVIAQLHDNICKANPTKPIRKALASAGYGGIKLKQVYRHIAYISYHPRRIAWSKARNGTNVIITKAQAEERLLKAGQGEHIDVQIARLNLLDAAEKLVIHREIKPYWMVNVSTFRNEQGASTNTKMRTSLPLFYLYDASLLIRKLFW